MLEPFYVSAAVVAVAEIGDKTQLLAIVLAARFRKPVPVILGILAATLLNHAAAATLGFLVSEWLTGQVLHSDRRRPANDVKSPAAPLLINEPGHGEVATD